jgi:hypothetical protein
MTDTLALEKLFDDVSHRFEDEETCVPNVFGWREPAKRSGQQNRIVWVPGDPSGAAGELVGARQPGRNPRPIATLVETFTVYLEARDVVNQDLQNELYQYKAARLLFDAWYRAVYLSSTGRNLVEIKSSAWMVDRKVRPHGATLRVICTIQAMIPDAPYAVAEDVEAVVDMQLDADDDETTPNASEDMDVPQLEET